LDIEFDLPTEGFADAAPNEAKYVKPKIDSTNETRLTYNGGRAEGPCGKSMLDAPATGAEDEH